MAFQWPRSSRSNKSRSQATSASRASYSNRRNYRSASKPVRGRSSASSASSSQTRSTPAPQHRRSQRPVAPRQASVASLARSASTAPPQSVAQSERLSSVQEGPEDDADTLNEIVMAVDMRERGTVGCSYYVAAEEKLYFMEDVRLSINPTIILISTRGDEQVTTLLDPDSGASASDTGESEHLNRPYLLEQRPAADFYYEPAKSKLVSLRVGAVDGPQVFYSIPGDINAQDDHDEQGVGVGQQAALLRLSSWIMVDSQLTVGCAGAVFCYLQRRRAARFLPGDADAQNMFRISSIEMFTLHGTMFINSDTLLSLQIMQSESHPHLHNQGPTKGTSGSKEGLSVYGLFHHLARTPQGKLMLRQWFLRPTLSLNTINERHEVISVFLRGDNAAGLHTIVQNLKRIVDVRKILVNLRKGVSASAGKSRGIARTVWRSLHLFAYHVLALKRALEEIPGVEALAIYGKIRAQVDVRSVAQVGHLISGMIDFERSDEEGRTIVRVGVDPSLDEQRHLYDGIDSLLSTVARDIASTIPEGLPLDLNVVYLPQIGFLITMPMDPETGRSMWEGTEDDVWEKMFSSETNVYYKDGRMRELDGEFGDVWNEICDKEIEIIHELVQKILEYEAALAAASDICGELDSLCALAQGAAQYRFCRPQMVAENMTDIRGGRHPLQELTVPSYVPNDHYIVGGSDESSGQDGPLTPRAQTSQQSSEAGIIEPSMLLMTGPNYSGKSVYLKQLALIVYLAHIGSFVPADTARIGLTDKILTRISTRESVSRNQSAFMIDLQQICMALSNCTPRSLLIIDEFGKGTNAADGAGLAAGVFEYLLRLGSRCPKVLGATHYHEIFEAGFLRPQPRLQFGHMEIRVDESTVDADEQITYLYNYRRGRSVASYGTICAAMNGIGPEVVRRAEELVLMTARGGDLVAACAAMPEAEMAELKKAETVARDFLAHDIEGDPREFLDSIVAASWSEAHALTDRSVVGAYGISS